MRQALARRAAHRRIVIHANTLDYQKVERTVVQAMAAVITSIERPLEQPWLLSVQANVEAAREHAFSARYYHHVPALSEIPGYRWGRRYEAVQRGGEYLALYEIEDASFLEHLIGADTDKRRPIARHWRPAD